MWFQEWSIRYLHDNAEMLLYIVLTSSFVKKKNNEITEDTMWTSLVHCHCDVSEKHIVLPSTVYSCLYARKSERLWLLPMMHQSWQSLLLFLMIVTPVPDAVRRWNLFYQLHLILYKQPLQNLCVSSCFVQAWGVTGPNKLCAHVNLV